MSDNQIEGGAGPALAAHSKDGSVPGATPASQATGEAKQATSELSGQAQQTVGQAVSSLSDMTRRARESVTGQSSQAAKQAADMVQAQPLMALAITAVACLFVGLLLGRR